MRRIIPVEAKELTKLAVKALEDKKAEDIKVIDISKIFASLIFMEYLYWLITLSSQTEATPAR